MGEPNPDPIMPAKSVFKGQGKASRSIQAMGSDEWNKRAKQVSRNHTGAAPTISNCAFYRNRREEEPVNRILNSILQTETGKPVGRATENALKIVSMFYQMKEREREREWDRGAHAGIHHG